MPWAAIGRIPDPLVAEWIAENPWYLQMPNLQAFALKIEAEIHARLPNAPVADILGLVTTRMRGMFPGQVDDTGYLAAVGERWIGAIPEREPAELINERPFAERLPLHDGQPKDGPSDLIWLVPHCGNTLLTRRMLGEIVQCLDRGGSLALRAISAERLSAAVARILPLVGGYRA